MNLGYLKVVDSTPLFVAVDKSYFGDAGLHVDLKEFTTGNALISAMVNGTISGATSVGMPPILFALEKKQPIKVIADGGEVVASSRPYLAIVAKRGSRIREAKDLVGKKVAINGYNTISDIFLQVVCSNAKLGNMVQLVTLPFPQMLNALRGKLIDAAVVIEPYVTIGLKNEEVDILVGSEQLVPSLRTSMPCVSERYHSQEQDSVENFRQAYNRATEFIMSFPQEARQIFAKHTGLSSEAAKELSLLNWETNIDIESVLAKHKELLATYNIKERGRVSVENLSVIFDGNNNVVAVKDLSLNVRAGEFVCLLGTTGCGKSTVLNTIAGFVQPTTGSVSLDDRPTTLPGLERGLVFQRPALFPWKTVKQNIEFGLKMKGISKKHRSKIVETFVQSVGLRGFEFNYPAELSGGMQQRVDIARVLANDPLVILMDEPFGSLDAQTRVMMQELLLRIWEEFGKTIIFVTHDVDEAIFLADRILVLTARPGRVKEEIPVRLHRPRSYDVVTSQEYVHLKKKLLGLIREETVKAMKVQNEV